jgi:hypothetical protein
MISSGTDLSAAERMVMQKPVQIHTPTTISMTVFRSRMVKKGTGRPPSAVMMALSRPICGPLLRYSYTKRQMMPAPTNEIAIGRKMIDLASGS